MGDKKNDENVFGRKTFAIIFLTRFREILHVPSRENSLKCIFEGFSHKFGGFSKNTQIYEIRFNFLIEIKRVFLKSHYIINLEREEN